MGCENAYDEIITGGLNTACRDFSAHCTVPVFDTGCVWFDTMCFFSSAQLRRAGIVNVTLSVRVSSMVDGTMDLKLTTDTGQERCVTAHTPITVLDDGVLGLTSWMLSAVMRDAKLTTKQVMVLGAHVEAISHKLSKQWAAMIKLFKGYTQLLGKGEG